MAGSSDQFLNLQKAIRQQALIHKRLLEQRLQFMDAFRRSAELTKRRIEEPFVRLLSKDNNLLIHSNVLSNCLDATLRKPSSHCNNLPTQLGNLPKFQSDLPSSSKNFLNPYSD